MFGMNLKDVLGPFSIDDGASWNDAAQGGRYSRDFFNRYGDLRHIRRLRFWPLNKVLVEKYEFSEQDANEMTEFLIPILDFVPDKRPTAARCLLHPWINAGPNVLEPSLPSSQNQALDSLNSEKKKREKDEREAMEIGLGNIAINVESEGVKDPTSSSVKLSQAATSSSSSNGLSGRCDWIELGGWQPIAYGSRSNGLGVTGMWRSLVTRGKSIGPNERRSYRASFSRWCGQIGKMQVQAFS
ncbi:unnamed protein product [Dovyalis caffra]|uniref:non-specific serine/threonine protein kinase n=1 Tax=Dovyalis caffra TaxID=77055 RepID=A0AAV1RZN6_9ROSI|nr:unnamed protein product [Dovyalis caffra]